MAMMHEPDDSGPVDRLYVRLAAALRQSRPNPFGAPVTVAEIYQELVPYRLVRTDAGFDMNADYEHALLRLLAGEGECVRLEPSAARDAIQRELRSNNPNVGMYREYAGCDVWVVEPEFTPAPGSIFALADDDTAESGQPDRGAGRESAGDGWAGTPPRSAGAWLDDAVDDQPDVAVRPAPASGGSDAHAGAAAGTGTEPSETASRTAGATADAAPEPAVRASAEAAAATDRTAGADAEPAGASASCRFCDSPLPGHRAVRFCPWCGADQSTRPCASCGEPMEADWIFCVACGTRPVD